MRCQLAAACTDALFYHRLSFNVTQNCREDRMSCRPLGPVCVCSFCDHRALVLQRNSPAVAERPRDASCLSVASFNSAIFYHYYFGFRFTTAYMLFCCLRCNADSAWLASCHKHFVVISRQKQAPPLTAAATMCDQLSTVCRSWVYCTWQSNRSQDAMEPDIGWESPNPPAFDAPGRRVPVRILPWRLVSKNQNSVATQW